MGRRAGSLRRLLVQGTVLGAVTLVGVTGASIADDSPPTPKPAPDLTGTTTIKTGVAQAGVADTRRAKQWIRIPEQLTAVISVNGQPRVPPAGATSAQEARAQAYLMGPDRNRSYGISNVFRVRTVAFGAIPVEATLQLAHEFVRGEPQAIELVGKRVVRTDGTTEVPDTDARFRLFVRIVQLKVDDTVIRFRRADACGTREAGQVELHGQGYVEGDPDSPENHVEKPWTGGLFYATFGGLLTGTMDVGPFAGCVTTTGDDLSPLLTATISGQDNPLRIHVGNLLSCQFAFDLPAPGTTDPRTGGPRCQAEAPPVPGRP